MKAAGIARIPRAPSAIEERLWLLIIGADHLGPHGERCRFIRPEREFRFHPRRLWRFDFAWPEPKIAAECEGGTWANGRHNRGAGFEADCEKYNAATLLGWRVLRFTSEMVNDWRAIDVLREIVPMIPLADARGA